MSDDSEEYDLALQITNLLKNSTNNQSQTQKQNLYFNKPAYISTMAQTLNCSPKIKEPTSRTRVRVRTGAVDGDYRCFVGGLAWATSDRSLEDAFSKYGEIVDSKIIYDRETGRSRGFGFVTFRDEQSLRDAIDGMNGQNIGGRNITVNKAHQSRSGGGGGLTEHIAGGIGFGDVSSSPSTSNPHLSSIFKPQYFPIEIQKLLEGIPLNLELSKEKIKKPLLQQEVRFFKNNKFETMGKANVVNGCDSRNDSWIFDRGATDTMTFDPSNIKIRTKPMKNHIQTASGEIIEVKGGGTVEVSPTMKLSN